MARVDEGAGDGPPREQDELDYSAAFEAGSRRVMERARKLAREREEVPQKLASLRRLPSEERAARLKSEPSLATWTLAERLIEETLRIAHSEAKGAAELAELAICVAAALSAAEHGAGLVEDLRARAWSACAEVRRLRSDLRGAQEAFIEAGMWIGCGTGDALEEARVMELEAVLQRDLERIEEAHRMLDSAAAIYRRCGDFHLVGRAYVENGRVFAAAHELDSALQWVRKGLGLLDSRLDPSLTLSAQHSLMLYLFESGRVHEAWFRLQATRADFTAAAGDLLNLRLTWLDGNLQRVLGMLAEAEAALAAAHAGFIAQGLGFEAALSGLDLMGLYAEQGRGAERRKLVESMPLFGLRDLPDEATAAREALRWTAESEGPEVAGAAEHVRTLADWLRQARRDSRLRFDELC